MENIKMLHLPNSNIGIWGGGITGKRFYFKLRRYYNIVCFFDNDYSKINEEVIENVRIEEYRNQKCYIIIAASKWKDISIQLQKSGLRLWKDFLPANLAFVENISLSDLVEVFEIEDILFYFKIVKKEKRLAMIYGNCQSEILASMLEFNTIFRRDFAILRIPPVHLYKSHSTVEKIFYSRIIKNIDLFIYQNVGLQNGYFIELASTNICNQLNRNCRQLRIHNIYFDGYFMQFDNSVKQRLVINSEKNFFPYADKYIHKLICSNYKTEDIIHGIMCENFIQSDEIFEKCEKSIKELENREKDVDVHIANYIRHHYQDCQLFYTRNHPYNRVLNIYANRILDILGYNGNPQMDEKELFLQFGCGMKNCDWPIYPSVIKTLKLKKYEKFFYTYTMIDHQLYMFDEFMKEYINRCT